MGSDGLVSLPHSPAAPQAPKAPGDLRRRRCPLNFKKPGSLETMARIQNAKKIWLQRAHFLARNPFITQRYCICAESREADCAGERAEACGVEGLSVPTRSLITKRPIKITLGTRTAAPWGRCQLAAHPNSATPIISLLCKRYARPSGRTVPKSRKTAFLEKFEILMGFYSAMNYSYWKKH